MINAIFLKRKMSLLRLESSPEELNERTVLGKTVWWLLSNMTYIGWGKANIKPR